MTVTTTENTVNYTANGVETVFSFLFKVLAEEDVIVYIDGVLVPSGYSVSLNADQDANPGGSVTFDTAPSPGGEVIIQRVVPNTQQTDLQPYGQFDSEVIETALDKLTMADQQVQEEMNRTLKLAVGTEDTDVTLPSAQPSTVVGWSADGLAMTNYPLDYGADGVTFISPKDYGGVGDGSADDTNAVQQAVLAAEQLSYRGVVDLGGLEWRISSSISASGFNAKVQNGKIRAHTSFVSGPAFNVTGGNFSVHDVYIDGRKDDLSQVMDGIWSQLGSNSFTRVEGRGFPNYGIRVDSGTDITIAYCDLTQWLLSDTENGEAASRTAIMYDIRTGDCYLDHCVGAYCKYPGSDTGVGTHWASCHFYNGASSGDVVTANRPTNFFVGPGASAKLDACYFDRGQVLTQSGYIQIRDCTFLQDDARQFDPVCITVQPTQVDGTLNGLTVTDCSITGSLNSGTNPLTYLNWIVVDTSLGAIVNADAVNVTGNIYHQGRNAPSVWPNITGNIKYRINVVDWVADGALWKTAPVDFSEIWLLPAYIQPSLVIGVEDKGTPIGNDLSSVWFSKSGGTEVRFWTDTPLEQTIHIAWIGSVGEILIP